ncbi:MAG: DUF4435 domain-containing protein [Alphaproteobacteria bacterium]|nr:DUF4435 domain-containing protein [Alphaproteobacteria bacterium]
MMSETDTYNYDVAEIGEDKYRKMQAADLRLAINSPSGEQTKWVLVEGRMDRDFFPIMFRKEVRIYIAGRLKEDDEKQEVQGGIKAVREVVASILADGYTTSIIGIVDRDYVDYRSDGDNTGIDHTGHIFVTDYRDLEMTLHTMPSAWLSITTLPEYTEPIIAQWEAIIRYLGAIRVANRHCSIYQHFDFSVGNLYNYQTRTIVPNWQDIAWNKAQKECNMSLKKEMLDLVEEKFHLTSTRFASYTRGHDAFKLLAIMLNNGKYSEAILVQTMINGCKFEECKSLQLYQDIANWELTHVEMLRK